eukprot:TRINITY_DN2671_c0_g2_i1.p1 TRINITY_DN2671_c0_g2~~TRINITY_DN2671_c0_g2_i1.p1  ORF type:complete len:326 (+),score=63.82 TRINITY_DN2671_c0_g2_i1:470-1447(+)
MGMVSTQSTGPRAVRRQPSITTSAMSTPTIKVDKKLYDEQGYVIVENLLSEQQVTELKDELASICKGERGKIKGGSLRKNITEDEILRKFLAIHFPHKISPLVLDLLVNHQGTKDVLSQIIGPNVKTMQSMMFMKSPGLPGQAWHQDEFYIPTRDRSLTGVWIALDPATVENGCLWVIPGSHRRGVLYPMKPHGDPRYDAADRAYGWEHIHEEETDAIPVVLTPGSAVFFNGYVLHRSLENKSTIFRRAFANHYMSAESLLPWNWDGRIPGYVEDNRDILMVCGEDPYAYKGIQTNMFPYVRAKQRKEGKTSNDEEDEEVEETVN